MEHIFISEGGYFWKQLPTIALPTQTDLFGNPLGDSKRNIQQHHGFFLGKRQEGKFFQVLLKITGKVTLSDDVLGIQEETILQSEILLTVPERIFNYDFQPGRAYIISTEQIQAL